MKRYLTILFLVLFVSVGAIVSAPTQASDSCDTTKAFDALSKLKASGDADKDISVLQSAISQARSTVIGCKGLHLEGKADKVNVVIIPAGLYLVWFRGQYTFSGDAIDGDCGQDKTSTNILIIPFPDNNFDAKVLKVGANCQATIKAGFGRGDWSIDFEPLAAIK